MDKFMKKVESLYRKAIKAHSAAQGAEDDICILLSNRFPNEGITCVDLLNGTEAMVKTEDNPVTGEILEMFLERLL